MAYEGNVRLGDLFESRREKGRPGLPLLSVTMNDGLVDRDDLDRKQETNLAAEDHLLVKPGDIAYNMMRMWQGAFGLAKNEGLVSPAYIVLQPKTAEIDGQYCSYLFKTKRMAYLFWAYSYGLTDDRLRLYYPDFSKIPAFLPSIKEQQKRASRISCIDEVIALQQRLLANTLTTKDSLLKKLLRPHGNEMKGGWLEIEFGELVELVRSQFNPATASQSPRLCIELEHVDQGTGILLEEGVTSSSSSMKLEFLANDVLFGKLRPYLRKYWLADRPGVCSSEFWVLRSRHPQCKPDFLKYLLDSDSFMRAVNASAGSKMPRAEWDYVSQAQVLVPPDSLQRPLVRVMKGFDVEVQTRRLYIRQLVKERDAMIEHLCAPEGSAWGRLG